MDKFERKYGRFAIRNLSLILIIVYAIGYLIAMSPLAGTIISFISLNPYLILKGQIWRIFTWVLIPPGSFSLLTLITLYFYYSIGTTLEHTWGTFRYNVYIFSGILFTVLGSFISLLFFYIYGRIIGVDGMLYAYQVFMLNPVSTYYISMSIFLAFAATFPNAGVLLFFIIPVKMKWLGILDGVFLLISFITGSIIDKIVIFTSMLNFIIFYVSQRRLIHTSPKFRYQQAKRRKQYQSDIKKEMDPTVPKHKCAICGKNEIDFPDTEFRFCSKCNGNYEYCSDHLFTHKHIE